MAEWIETFKGVIDAREYDPNAHMNTQAYVSRFDQATWFLLAAVGLTPRTVRELKRRVAVLRQSFNFVHELKGSELIVIKSGFVAVGEKHLRFQHRMVDTESDMLMAACDGTAVEVDLESGRAVPIEAAIKDRAKALLVTANDAERIDLDARL
ncbi:MAG: thioesterase family protein [Candidatus Odyssella sp.]|nr:thioesterase family protein [Candidatus Odyssella sp.]